MSFTQKLVHELRSMALTMVYFILWFALMITLKELLLREYNIDAYGVSKALIGALIVAKVILIVDGIRSGGWVSRQPAIVDILLRTFWYSLGIILVLILEHSFEKRHEYGGFLEALKNVFSDVDVNHLYVNSVAVIFSLLLYNIFTLLNKKLGDGGIRQVLFSPLGANTK